MRFELDLLDLLGLILGFVDLFYLVNGLKLDFDTKLVLLLDLVV